MKRLCMIGAGRVGVLHTRNIAEHLGRRARVTAVCDPNIALAAQLAAEHGIELAVASFEDALTRGEFDGVVITTPTFTHRDLAVRALDAGLHVHLEKPMAMNFAECVDITAAAERAGVALQLGFMRRHDRDFRTCADLLRSDEFGDPMIVKSLTHGPGLPPAWANDIRTSNGMLAEVNSHDLDTVCWFADSEPVDIYTRVANFKGVERGVATPNFYDTLLAIITFGSGALATVAGVCPADYGYDSRVEVTCTKGMIRVGETGPGGIEAIVAGTSQSSRPVFRSWRDRFALAYVSEMVGFVDAMDGATPRAGAKDGERAVALVLAGTLSMLEGRTVKIDEVTDPAFVPTWQRAS